MIILSSNIFRLAISLAYDYLFKSNSFSIHCSKSKITIFFSLKFIVKILFFSILKGGYNVFVKSSPQQAKHQNKGTQVFRKLQPLVFSVPLPVVQNSLCGSSLVFLAWLICFLSRNYFVHPAPSLMSSVYRLQVFFTGCPPLLIVWLACYRTKLQGCHSF
jgi:hypothetical protein